MRIRNNKGQTATEYMLIVGVIVIGLVIAARAFVDEFDSVVQTISETVQNCVKTGKCQFGG